MNLSDIASRNALELLQKEERYFSTSNHNNENYHFENLSSLYDNSVIKLLNQKEEYFNTHLNNQHSYFLNQNTYIEKDEFNNFLISQHVKYIEKQKGYAQEKKTELLKDIQHKINELENLDFSFVLEKLTSRLLSIKNTNISFANDPTDHRIYFNDDTYLISKNGVLKILKKNESKSKNFEDELFFEVINTVLQQHPNRREINKNIKKAVTEKNILESCLLLSLNVERGRMIKLPEITVNLLFNNKEKLQELSDFTELLMDKKIDIMLYDLKTENTQHNIQKNKT